MDVLLTEAQKKLAVVTGASSGIGAAFAQALAKRGFDLVIIARRTDRLNALVQKLEGATGISVHVMTADLTDSETLRNTEGELQSIERIDLLVNCAGFGTYARFTDIDPGRIKRELVLDLLVPISLTRAALPRMLARKQGAIINVSSMAGFIPIPRHAAYCAAKAGLTRFTEALHGELAGTGVRVQAFCPGPVPTEFFHVSGYKIEDVPGYMIQSVDECIESALRFLATRRVVYIPHRFIRMFVGILRLLPLSFQVRILGSGPKWLNG